MLGRRLGEDHLARVVERQVNKLNRSEIDRAYRGSGSEPYDPLPLLKMVLYQYLKGNQSPARWSEEAKLNEAMRWLGRGYMPARRTWYDFRDRAGKFIEQVHEQIVSHAVQQGVEPTVGVQDGTAMAACASRHRMLNRSTLQKRIDQLDAILTDTFECPLPKWVPPTHTGKLDLAKRMNKARVVLEERIAKNAEKPKAKRNDPHKILVSLSDPIAAPGRDKLKVFRPLYTVQCMVAPVSYLTLSYSCEAQATDAGTLAPMIDKTQRVVGGRLKTVLADAAYCSILDLEDCHKRDIELLAPVQSNSFTQFKKPQSDRRQISKDQFQWDEAKQTYRCPAGHHLNYHDRTSKQRHSGRELSEIRYRCSRAHCSACPLAKQCLRPGATYRTIRRLEGHQLLQAQRAKMNDPEVQRRYQLRSQTVELAYADIKGNRKQQSFHGRGLARARAETGLMVVARNLLRLDRLQRNHLNPEKIQT